MRKNHLNLHTSAALIFCAAAILFSGCAEKPPAPKPEKVKVKQKPSAPPLTAEALMPAALEGKLETIKNAISNSTDINMTDTQGNTALMYAAFNGHSEVVKALLKAGAKVDTKGNLGRTALMFACTGTDSATVEILIRNGAKVNATDSHENFTPLMWAAAEGRARICKILLAEGADPNMADDDGDKASDFATQRGHTELAASLRAAEKK